MHDNNRQITQQLFLLQFF